MDDTWTFLTNHAHVLACVADNPEVTLREVAERVGITERSAHRIVGELERGGALVRSRNGRRNRYEVQQDVPLRHPMERHCSVGQLLTILCPGNERQAS